MDLINLGTSLSRPLVRRWMTQGATNFNAETFVLPLFIINDDNDTQDIPSMPQVHRYGINSAMDYLQKISAKGLRSILLFPVVSEKGVDKACDNQFNPVLRLIPEIKKRLPSLHVIVDVCLCGFTIDGHCYVGCDDGSKDFDGTLEMMAKLSIAYAKAGCDMVAPSDMNDGRVAAIRQGLNEAGFRDVSIMSYSAKFASNFYGPFRDAAGSAPKHGDRKCYQVTPGSKGLAMRGIERDIKEGADIIMVKPGLPYLDILSEARNRFPDVPRAVYHVSGEYSMLYRAGESGCLDLTKSLWEIMTSFKRAGADIIITYFTPLLLEIMDEIIM